MFGKSWITSIFGVGSIGAAVASIGIDVANKQLILEASGKTGGTKLIVDAASSSLYTTGTMQIGTAGAQALEHATTIEAVARLFYAFLALAGAAATTPIALAAFFATFVPPATGAAFAAIIKAAGALSPNGPPPDLAAVAAAIVTSLQTPRTPALPGLAAQGLLI